MLHAQASERELIDQFLAALRSLPEVQAELERAGAPELDAQLALDVAGKRVGPAEVRRARVLEADAANAHARADRVVSADDRNVVSKLKTDVV